MFLVNAASLSVVQVADIEDETGVCPPAVGADRGLRQNKKRQRYVRCCLWCRKVKKEVGTCGI